MTVTVRSTEAVMTGTRAGDWVSWRASRGEGRGQVVSVHSAQHVPAVAVRLEGTPTRPAARIRMFARVEGGWAPTDTYVALHCDGLNTLAAPLPPPPDPVAPTTEALTPGSFDDLRNRVRLAIQEMLAAQPGAGSEVWVYVADIGPGWVVFESGSNLWQCVWSEDTPGTVSLGAPEQVYELTTYVTTGGTESEATDSVVGRLLAAAPPLADGTREFSVRILEYGVSLNNRVYTEAVMRPAAPLYEGAKAYDHHRTAAELSTSTVAGIVGSYHGVTATSQGLEATLRLLPSAGHVAELLDRSLENQAQGLEPLVGISHDVLARYTARMVEGRRLEEATQIVSVASADVVASPAAGGRVTRMVASHNPTTTTEEPMNLKQLLALLRAADATARFELLREHAAVITAAGLDEDELIRMAEAVPPPLVPVVVEATATTKLAKASALTRLVASSAVTQAGLSERLTETVLADLPDEFTEGELLSRVAVVQKVQEGFERASLLPRVPDVKVVGDEHDRKIKALDGLFSGDYSVGYRSLKEAYADITGQGPKAFDSEDWNRQILRESIVMDRATGRPFDSGNRATESLATASWAFILGDAITRRMVATYAQPSLSGWQQLVSSRPPINDFRVQRVQRLGGYGLLPPVLEGAPYQSLTSPTNDAETTWSPSKRGGTEDLTLEQIANDDIRAIQQIPQKLGLAAALTIYRFVFDFFVNNAAVNDGVALFHATHANTTATALSSSALSASRRNLRLQASYGDAANVLSLTPRFLLVGSTLEELAYQLCTSAVALPAGAPAGGAANTPNLHAGLEFMVVDYWSSQTAWFLVADPGQCPTIEIGFYQGRADPELFSQSDPQAGSVWSADKISYKIRHVYGGNILDYRAFQRGNV